MVKKPNFSNYNSTRFHNFFKSTLDLLERANEPTLTPHLTPLIEMVNALDEGYKLDRDNLLTANIVAADKRRDNATDGIRRVVSGYELHFEAEKRAAAALLMRNFKKHGNIARLPYHSQSSALSSMLNSWQEATHAAAIAMLGLEVWRNELQAAQAEFNDLYLTRIEDEAAKTAVPIYKLRPDAVKVYNNLEVVLKAFAQINPAVFAPIISLLDELIQKFNTAVLMGKSEDEDTKTV